MCPEKCRSSMCLSKGCKKCHRVPSACKIAKWHIVPSHIREMRSFPTSCNFFNQSLIKFETIDKEVPNRNFPWFINTINHEHKSIFCKVCRFIIFNIISKVNIATIFLAIMRHDSLLPSHQLLDCRTFFSASFFLSASAWNDGSVNRGSAGTLL